jgi:hypothetical protein
MEYGCGSASVAANTCHFEDLSDSRVSELRTVNCIYEIKDVGDTLQISAYQINFTLLNGLPPPLPPLLLSSLSP